MRPLDLFADIDAHAAADVLWFTAMAIPAMLALGGWSTWRKACPVRRLSEAGPQIGWRLPAAWQRHTIWFTAAGFAAVLTLRVTVLEHSAWATLLFLAAGAALAWLTGRLTTGRTFCHHICPIGYVERVYLAQDDGPALPCASCSGCTVACPDLDPRRGAAALRQGGRQKALHAAPGMALAYLTLHQTGVAGDGGGITTAAAAILGAGALSMLALGGWEVLRRRRLGWPEAWRLAAAGTLAAGITGTAATLSSGGPLELAAGALLLTCIAARTDLRMTSSSTSSPV